MDEAKLYNPQRQIPSFRYYVRKTSRRSRHDVRSKIAQPCDYLRAPKCP